jgi:hypothetical protein
MKQNIKKLLLMGLLVIFLTATVFTFPVGAAAPTISAVTPTVIVNDIVNTITVDGTGFTDQAEVRVGSEAMVVTSFSATQLIVRVPSGFLPGHYSLTVTNPGPPAESFTFSPALEVVSPTPTPPPPVSGRPQVVIDTYSTSVDLVRYNQDFTFNVSLDNAGGSTAHGLQVSFTSTDLLMLKNGGIVAAGDLGVVGKAGVSQTMTAAAPLTGLTRVSLDMTVSYSDDKGAAFTDKFTLFFPVASSGSGSAQPSKTPSGLQRSQLVITDYETDVDPLQPGYEFSLSITVQNVGNVTAKGVTMIVGGGSTSGSGSGTPQPGGINGGSGEFTNFAPVGTSNLQSLGDFEPGKTLTAKQKLIVNVSANPGAFPMKISFAYTDANGNAITDDQVITLLVYSLPNVDVGFYQPVGDFVVGQPGPLPLQVSSLGKRTAVLGKMKVESPNGTVENGEMLIGSLDPGGYFTLDATLIPNVPGPMDLTVTIEYTDDFNQSQTLTKTIPVNVMDAPIMPTPDPNSPDGGVDIPTTTETFWQKMWRFILGLFGLDSAAPTITPDQAIPTEPQIFPPIKGGGGKG